MPRSSIESRMSRSENALHHEAAGRDRLQQAFVLQPHQRQPHRRARHAGDLDRLQVRRSARRRAAGRTGSCRAARAARARSATPSGRRPSRSSLHSAACSRGAASCATIRSISAPRPHRAGVDVEIVEDAVRILVHRALLRFEDDLVLAEDAGRRLRGSRWSGVCSVEPVVAHEGPEIVAGGLGLRRHGVEHEAVDALRAVALRRAAAGGRDADVDRRRCRAPRSG